MHSFFPEIVKTRGFGPPPTKEKYETKKIPTSWGLQFFSFKLRPVFPRLLKRAVLATQPKKMFDPAFFFNAPLPPPHPWYWCYYPHRLRDSVCPVGGIKNITLNQQGNLKTKKNSLKISDLVLSCCIWTYACLSSWVKQYIEVQCCAQGACSVYGILQ